MSLNRILVVDDETGIRELLSEILRDEGYVVLLAENAAAARTIRKEQRPDLVLLDIWMPDTDGITLLKEWASGGLLTMPVIMMSGHGTIETAMEATRIGAIDFLEKPVSLPKLLATVGRALSGARAQPRPGLTLTNLGRTRVVQEVKQRLEQVLRLKTPVLLTGEAGCGFELAARFLHQPNTPWVAPADMRFLAENPFEPLREAREGLLFLCDIGHLDRAQQKGLSQLLGKLDKFAIRLVCATAVSLAAQAERHEFDRGLFDALSGLAIPIPSLRDHAEDIPDLANLFLLQMVDANEAPFRQFSVAALNALRNLPWPGNLPSLANAVKTLALTALGNEITADDVARIAPEFHATAPAAVPNPALRFDLPLREAREAFEQMYFEYLIGQEHGNMSRVADRAGFERTHLYRKLKQLGIKLPGRGE